MILYWLVIFFYRLSIFIAAVFNEKARKWIIGRKKILLKIQQTLKNEKDDIIWVHCSSLGEFEQGRPLIETLKKKYKNKKIFLTFFSPSGYEIRKNYTFADYVFYLPIDTKRNAKKFVETVKPKMVFFIKYEFWYFYLITLKKIGIPLYLVAANFRDNQLFFKPWGAFYRKTIYAFTHIFVQNKHSKRLLKSIDFNDVTVAGDTRFDRVYQIVKENRNIPFLSDFKQGKKIIICGSTWPPDEKYIIRWINEKQFDVKYIIAPHKIDNKHIENIIHSLKVKYVLYSDANEENVVSSDVLIVNTIGILSALYRYGDIAYIGGGFGSGIHNILEPAAFGLPIIFGPKYYKFQEAKDLLKIKGAITYRTYSELVAILQKCFNSQVFLKDLQQRTLSFVHDNLGSTQKILSKIRIVF